MPNTIMKAGRVINSEALNAQFIVSENNRKAREEQRIQEEQDRIAHENERIEHENQRIREFQEKLDSLEGTDTAQFHRRVQTVESELRQIETKKADEIALVIERERINLIQTNPGSTSGDLALNDIKIAFNGKVYETPSQAVRGQAKLLNDSISISSNLNKSLFTAFYEIEQGSLSNTDGSNMSANNRCRTKNIKMFYAGEKVTISGSDTALIMYVIKYDAYGVFESNTTINGKEYTFDSDCYARISFRYSDNAYMNIISFAKFIYYLRKISEIEKESLYDNSIFWKLNKRKYCVVGDSIMRGYGNADIGALELMKNKYDNFELTNNAVSGAKLTTDTTALGTKVSITDISLALPVTNYDVIIMDGGVNDTSHNYIGTVSDFFVEDTEHIWNTRYVCGALEKIFSTWLVNNPKIKIIYIFPHYISNSKWQGTIRPAITTVLEKWGIPYLDLQKKVPPLGVIDTLKSTYTYNADAYHPNELGYNSFYVPQIEDFIRNNI